MRNDLLQAYIGVHEDKRETRECYETHARIRNALGLRPLPFPFWFGDYCKHLINEATPRERLETYLEWNGIIGYTQAIFEIATQD